MESQDGSWQEAGAACGQGGVSGPLWLTVCGQLWAEGTTHGGVLKI